MRPLVTLLTDFGTADGYVAEMKGVLMSSVPEAMLLDLSHELAPQDVESARLALARCWRRFPPATVHLVVVDPGVGSSRRALAVESDDRLLVGPDNGVLSPALLLAGARVVELPIPPTASPTFHGRDVFAPAAALLAAGAPLDTLGSPVTDAIVRRTPEARRRADGALEGEVIAVDRFGNAITNLLSRRGGVLEVAGRSLPVRRTYADVARGDAVALCGSSGLVEVAVRDGSAASVLGIGRGTIVVWRQGQGAP
jgi:S-adenosylmethionine hydrolase